MKVDRRFRLLGTGTTTTLALAALGAAAALPAGPAAASITWQAGPLNLGAGKIVQVAVSNPNPFSCIVSVQLYAGPPGRVVTGGSTGSMTLVLNGFHEPELMPAGAVAVVGFHDPNLMPEQRRLVTARVQTDCANVAAADIRTGLAVTLQAIGHPDIAPAVLVAQGR